MAVDITQKSWQKLDKVLDEALSLPEERRVEALRSACADDTTLLRKAMYLLQLEKNAPVYLDQAACVMTDVSSGENHGAEDDAHQHLIGCRLGAYELAAVLGAGGMGVVYRASRVLGDYAQDVAIKILTESRDKKQFAQRFKREQQALAVLCHPNIAGILDAGMTEQGRPYFVMEYVDGIAIDKYANKYSLDLEERLGLIRVVVEVLSFAHRNLVVHRDIKPSNILVNANGQIKLLDFGIAKFLADDHENDHTVTIQQPLSFGSAAPEQLKNGTITVATDIYQLGLLAYQLITGVDPFQAGHESLAKRIQLVCESDPLAPSSAVSSQPALSRTLRGDIDAIVLKMLATEPEQRYISMDAVGQDLDAFAASRPVAARTLRLSYVARKFLRRHWQGVLVAGAFTLMLSFYGISTHIQNERILKALNTSQIEANKARQVSQYLIDIFQSADPFQKSDAKSITARQLLDHAQQDIDDRLGNYPEVKAHMLKVLGEINLRLGGEVESLQLLEQSLALYEQHSERDSAVSAELLLALGNAYEAADKHDLAEDSLKRAMSALKASTKSDKVLIQAEIQSDLAFVYYQQGQRQKAAELWRVLLDDMTRDQLQSQPVYSVTLNNLAAIAFQDGQFERAIALQEEAIEVMRDALGEKHPRLAFSLKNLAVKYRDLEYFDKAEAGFRETLAILLATLPADHQFVLKAQRDQAVLWQRLGRLDLAIQTLVNVANRQVSVQGETSLDASITQLRLANALIENGEFGRADELLIHLQHHYDERDPGPVYQQRLDTQKALLAMHRDDHVLADTFFSQALQRRSKMDMHRSGILVKKAWTQGKLRQFSEALALAESALQFRKNRFEQTHSLVAEAEFVLANLQYMASGSSEHDKVATQTAITLTTKRRGGDYFVQAAQVSIEKNQSPRLSSH